MNNGEMFSNYIEKYNNGENYSLFNLQKNFTNNQNYNKNSSINYTLKSLSNAFNISRPIKLSDNITKNNDFSGKIQKYDYNN